MLHTGNGELTTYCRQITIMSRTKTDIYKGPGVVAALNAVENRKEHKLDNWPWKILLKLINFYSSGLNRGNHGVCVSDLNEHRFLRFLSSFHQNVVKPKLFLSGFHWNAVKPIPNQSLTNETKPITNRSNTKTNSHTEVIVRLLLTPKGTPLSWSVSPEFWF